MNCERCGKEILIEDKIDNGYVDWCSCDYTPIRSKCSAGGNGGFKINPPKLRDLRCIHEYFIPDDKYYYREVHLKNTIKEIRRLLTQEAGVYFNGISPEKMGYRIGMIKSLEILDLYIGDLEND